MMKMMLKNKIDITLSTKTVVKLAYFITLLMVGIGLAMVALWVYSLVPQLSADDPSRSPSLFIQLMIPPFIVIAIGAMMVYWFIMDRYLFRPLELVKKQIIDSQLKRPAEPAQSESVLNQECADISCSINGIVETLQYADNLASQSQLLADHLYETVINYKNMFGVRSEVDYKEEIRKYTPEQRILIVKHLSLAMSLNSMHLSFLPQVAADNEGILAMDALIRWEDQTLGSMDPLIFLAIAEESGLIVKLTTITLHKASQAIKQWSQFGITDQTVSINLSLKQFYDPELVSKVQNISHHTGVEPKHFEFEVGEAILYENLAEAFHVAQKLSQIGVKLTVDHYKGSLLTQYDLNRLKIGKIKLDYSFSGEDQHIASEEFITKLLELAQEMSIYVVAVGIESHQQDEMWRKYQGPLALQGFFYGEPANLKGAEIILRQGSIAQSPSLVSQQS